MDSITDYSNVLSIALENAAEAVFVTRHDGVILYVNKAFEKVTGWSRESILGKNPRVLRSGVHDNSYYTLLYDTLNKGAMWSHEVHNVKRDGSPYVAWQTISPIKDDNGKIQFYLAIHNDITEQRDLERSLNVARRDLEEAQQLATVGSFSWAADSNTIHGSDVFFSILEMEPTPFISMSEFISILHPDDKDEVKQHFNNVVAIHHPIDEEFRIIVAGDTKHVRCIARPQFNDDHLAVGLFGTFQDITDAKLISLKLKNSEARYRGLIESQTDMVVRIDLQHNITFTNESYCKEFGKSAEEAIGSPLLITMNLEESSSLLANLRRAILPPYRAQFEEKSQTSNGWKWHQWEFCAIFDTSGTLVELQGVGRDISRLKKVEEALSDQLRFIEEMMEALPNPIYYKDKKGRFLGCNRAFEHFLIMAKRDIVTKRIDQLIDFPKATEIHQMSIQLVATGDGTATMEFVHSNKYVLVNETLFKSATGEVIGIIGVMFDMTSMKKAEEQIRHMALHDVLTGLPNRAMFNQRIDAIINKRRSQDTSAILLIDLDHFKDVNDTLGHGVGDQLLVEVGRRLASCVRDDDLVSRLGGDEFAVILHHITDEDAVASVAKKVITSIREPIVLKDHTVHADCSVGITIYPQDGNTRDSLTKQADMALYKSKEEGRGRYHFFSEEMNAKVLRRKHLEDDLRYAIQKNELMVFFQPRIDINTNVLTGMEALVRWKHTKEGFISPDEFIKIAELSGQIGDVFTFVLTETIRTVGLWKRTINPDLFVSVNLSPAQFSNVNLIPDIKAIMDAHEYDPSALQFEITENVLVEHTTDNLAIMNGIQAMGCKVSIDDFGTGYSSLVYLKKFHLDSLKIDKSFVWDLEDSNDSRAITTAIIGLATNLGLKVVAEGVETRHQLDILRELGCDEGQGYLFAKPIPKDEFEVFMHKWNEKYPRV